VESFKSVCTNIVGIYLVYMLGLVMLGLEHCQLTLHSNMFTGIRMLW
jgi:hypothetical protein